MSPVRYSGLLLQTLQVLSNSSFRLFTMRRHSLVHREVLIRNSTTGDTLSYIKTLQRGLRVLKRALCASCLRIFASQVVRSEIVPLRRELLFDFLILFLQPLFFNVAFKDSLFDPLKVNVLLQTRLRELLHFQGSCLAELLEL